MPTFIISFDNLHNLVSSCIAHIPLGLAYPCIAKWPPDDQKALECDEHDQQGGGGGRRTDNAVDEQLPGEKWVYLSAPNNRMPTSIDGTHNAALLVPHDVVAEQQDGAGLQRVVDDHHGDEEGVAHAQGVQC